MRIPLTVLALVASLSASAPAARSAPAPPTPELSVTPAKPPILAAEVEKWFPAGPVQAEVLDVVSEPRYDAIVSKMRAAVLKQPEWWQEYSHKNTDARGMVAWDAKMGITKAEYDEMMKLSAQLHLARIAQTTLTFKREAGGEITIDGGVAASELTGLRFSRDRQSVGGAYGKMEGRKDVHQTDATAPSGLWNGVEWRGMSNDSKSGHARMSILAMGRMSPSNLGLLFFSVREMVAGRPAEKSRVVRYPIAAQ
jgi:hypothetical protein